MPASCEFESMAYVDEQSIDPNLICIICTKPFKDPVCTPCDHSYGRACITEWLVENNKDSCPTCKHTIISVDGLTQASRPLRNMLDGIRVQCLLCDQAFIQRGSFADHLGKTCPKAKVSCSAADIRCPWQGLREDLENHNSTCIFEPLRPVLEPLIAENRQLNEQVQRHERVIRQLAEQMTEIRTTANDSSDEESDGSSVAASGNSGAFEREENTIFVRNLPVDIKFNEAFEFFSKAGRIKYDAATQKPHVLIMRPPNQKGQCNAKVIYMDAATANKAVLLFDKKHIPEWNVRLRAQISYARKKDEKHSGKTDNVRDNTARPDASVEQRKTEPQGGPPVSTTQGAAAVPPPGPPQLPKTRKSLANECR